MSSISSTNKKLSSSVEYKDDIVKLFGGMAQYEMIILEFCCRLRHEKRLQLFYGDFDFSSLLLFQRETLDWAFTDYVSLVEQDKAEDRIMLHHYRMLDNGLSNYHGQLVCQHFIESLRHSWVDEKVITIAVKHLKCWQTIFGAMGSLLLDDTDVDNDTFSSSSCSDASTLMLAAPESQQRNLSSSSQDKEQDCVLNERFLNIIVDLASRRR